MMMNLHNKTQEVYKKAAAILLIAAVLSVLFLSDFFIAENIHHQCTGESCPVCAEIQHAESLIHQIGSAIICFASVVCIVAGSIAMIPSFYQFFQRKTLISYKVRLND